MDTVFFVAGKAVWLLVRPETLILAGYGLSLILLWRRWYISAFRTLLASFTVSVVVGVTPIGDAILAPLERIYPAEPFLEDITGIIVLGGSEKKGLNHAGVQSQVSDNRDRISAAIDLSRRFPEAIVLYSGGKGTINTAKAGEFELGPDLLRRLGLPDERLIVEGQSRTTAENARLSRAMLSEYAQGKWVLVTSAFHMPRAYSTFCAAGWRNLSPYPTDYHIGDLGKEMGWRFSEHLRDLSLGVKELLGLLAYRLTGRIETFFPKSC